MRSFLSAKRSLLLSFFSLGACFSVGCSLTNVTNVNVGECTTDEGCNSVLNPIDGNYEGCMAYRCDDSGDYPQCKKITGEICDGLDNDCDYLVDESDDEGTTLVLPDREELVQSIETLQVTSVVSSNKLSGLYLQTSDGVGTVPLAGGTSESIVFMTNASETNGLDTDLVGGCRPGGAEAGVCSTSESVVSGGENQGFFTTVNTLGCTAGNLRVGTLNPDGSQETLDGGPEVFIDRGPGYRDPTWEGVNVDPDSKCTNNASEACESAISSGDNDAVRASCGATAPSIATVSWVRESDGRTYDHALTTFLAAPATESACGKTVDVAALVLQGRASSGNDYHWVDPTNEGIPEKIGTTRGGTSAGILGLDDRGYLIGHGDEDGNVRISWLPRQEPSGSTNGRVACPDDDCNDRTGRETDPLSGLEEFITLNSRGSTPDTGSVDLTLLDITRDRAALLVTWVEGCLERGGPDQEAYAQVLHLDLSGSGAPEIDTSLPRLGLGSTSQRPVAIGSSADFIVEGYPGEGETAAAEETKGFYISLKSDRPSVQRVIAYDGKLVDPQEEIELGGGSLSTVAKSASGEVGFFTHDTSAANIGLTPLTCR